jgi:MbtH protein
MRTVTFDFESPDARFKVLVNQEQQYSIWPADLHVPGGWTETGVTASKAECDRYLEEAWTDMRPASLRAWMASGANTQPDDPPRAVFPRLGRGG